MNARRCTVYRCYRADGSLLYVGSTLNSAARLAYHARSKDWWADVARIDLEHFASEHTARAAEAAAITAERPALNRQGSPNPPPRVRREIVGLVDPMAVSVEEAAEMIGVSRRKAYQLAADDPDFPAYRIGRRIVVSVAGLREWDARRREQAA